MKARAVLALLLWGCGTEDVVLSYAGSEANYLEAQSAAQEWRDVCGARIYVTREPGHVPLVGVAAADWRGATASIDGRPIWIRFVDDEWAAPTLRHEMGHALDLDDGERGIMRQGSGLLAVTADDCVGLR